MSMNTRPITFGLAALLLLPGLAQAQIKTQPDGHWRQILGAGASFASGNSNINSFNLHYDLARQTRHHTVAQLALSDPDLATALNAYRRSQTKAARQMELPR